MELEGFEGRSAIITGGARGIGRQIAETLRDLGATVTVGDLSVPDVPGCLNLQLDVTSEESVKSAVAQSVSEAGTPSILVLNAGVFHVETLENTSLAMWNQTLYKRQLDLERLYLTTLQWIPEKDLQPILDNIARGITASTPPRESRQVHRSIDWCMGTGNNVAVKATIFSTGGYLQTGLLQAYGARRLISETPRVAGFRSPSQVFDHHELLGTLKSYGYAALQVERLV